MSIGQKGAVDRQLRTLFQSGTSGASTDGELIDQFVNGSERAFEVLLDRHGPMVFRVCRSILHDEHDAEDAFQAVFVVLARRARSLWVRDSIGPWLHGVAYRVAMRARSAQARRYEHEPGRRRCSPIGLSKATWVTSPACFTRRSNDYRLGIGLPSCCPTLRACLWSRWPVASAALWGRSRAGWPGGATGFEPASNAGGWIQTVSAACRSSRVEHVAFPCFDRIDQDRRVTSRGGAVGGSSFALGAFARFGSAEDDAS